MAHIAKGLSNEMDIGLLSHGLNVIYRFQTSINFIFYLIRKIAFTTNRWKNNTRYINIYLYLMYITYANIFLVSSLHIFVFSSQILNFHPGG